MNAHTSERSAFDPPAQGGFERAFAIALVAHALLIAALTWGLHWKNAPQDDAVETELWAPTPERAAPRRALTPPQPPQPTAAPPAPQPKPEPVPAPPPPEPEVDQAELNAQIALTQKKEREAKERKLAQERETQRLKELKQRELAQKKAADEAKRKQELAEAEAKKKEAKRKEQLAKAAEAKKEAEADKKAETARRMAALRRTMALAGAEEGSEGRIGGTDRRNSGPSGSYAGLIRAAVRPNIVFTSTASGNPVTEIEVRTDVVGKIIARKITKSSGNKAWDAAVIRALDRTDKLPSDKGRYWNPMLITFKLHD